MRTAWDDHAASTTALSDREEADLIVALASVRAAEARQHPSDHKCTPCHIRRHDQLRIAAIRMSKAGA